MGAFSLHVFLVACGRASVECMRRKCALFLCIEGGLRRHGRAVCLHIADKGGRE